MNPTASCERPSLFPCRVRRVRAAPPISQEERFWARILVQSKASVVPVWRLRYPVAPPDHLPADDREPEPGPIAPSRLKEGTEAPSRWRHRGGIDNMASCGRPHYRFGKL